ncbi:uncharacterized protein LOC116287282 [Actinia tenebrosa]|uniref:Uncharacterized protein LOC116287282 n=1 Tax=Actinia tenebrosa TaxID=6105 RepID=A0A6P8H2Z4_ACTTE|nr:uncharacterized protein LOC116287282 [Actinia tenebrosa]
MDSGTIRVNKRLIVRANPEVNQRKLVVRHVKPCDDVHPVGFRVQSKIVSSAPEQQQKVVQVSVPRQDLRAAQFGKPQQNYRGPKYSINVPLIQLNITNKGIEPYPSLSVLIYDALLHRYSECYVKVPSTLTVKLNYIVKSFSVSTYVCKQY